MAELAARATEFGRPVLMVVGDFHDYRVDVGVPWFSTFYGVTPPPNLTQVVVDRSIEATSGGEAKRAPALSVELPPWIANAFARRLESRGSAACR